MYLVSVYFDDKSNKIISDYINKIAQKTGNTFMTDNHVPPHLTIMSVEAREEDKLTEVMGKLERYLTKGQIQLVSVGVLLPYVLYVTPVLNLYLEDMIEQVHDMVKNIPEVRMSRYYQPMQWLPHITLGKKTFQRADAGSICSYAGTIRTDGSYGIGDRAGEDQSTSGSCKNRIK